jgi:hypothetical protein
MRKYPIGVLLPYQNHFSKPLESDIKSGEIMKLIEHLDLRKCNYDGLYYPRAYMVLTSDYGLIAEQYAIKIDESEYSCMDNEYLGFILNPIFRKESEAVNG